MSPIKAMPAYWHKLLCEDGKTVRCFNIFMTLSCANLRWNDVILIMSNLRSLKFSMEDINVLSRKMYCFKQKYGSCCKTFFKKG